MSERLMSTGYASSCYRLVCSPSADAKTLRAIVSR